MTIHQILHILRNPYGKTEAEIRRARLAACGYIVEACEVLQTIIDHDGKLTGGDFATIRALLAKLDEK